MSLRYVPKPTPIVTVSPTLANALLACPLRVAFSRDPGLSALAHRPRPEAILGSASHALAEAVVRGDFDESAGESDEDTLAARWEEMVAKGEEGLRAQVLLGPVPVPARWPFFEAKRAAAVRLASRLLAVRGQRYVSDGSPPGRVVDVELDLACDDPPLRGRIDRVERTDAGVRIVDLKSAVSHGTDALPASYEVQLLLYAALYRGATGEMPFEVAIQYFDGTRVKRRVDWTAVDKVVGLVLALRDQVNALARCHTPVEAESLGRPDSETCLYCDYQPVCGPFFAEVAADLPPYASSVTGDVVHRTQTGTTVRIEVAPASPELGASESDVAVIGVPVAVAPVVADRVSVCWAFKGGRRSDLRVNWLSVIYNWEECTEDRPD